MSETSQSILVNMPMSLYTASRSFKAISNGKIYVGIPDTDPVYPENQVPVYIVNESGNKIQIPQPIVINSGGHPVYNGQIINKIITDEQYSLAVYDSYGSQEYYFDNVVRYDPEALMQLLAGKEGYSYIGELQSAADFFGLVKNDGARVKLRSWYAGWSGTTYGKPKGGGEFIFQANVPKAKHDGCIYFSPTVPYSTNLSSYVTGQGETDPTGSGVWVRDIGDATHIHTDWAGVCDGSGQFSASSHSDAVQKVFNACSDLNKHVFFDEGWTHLEKPVTLTNFVGNTAALPHISGVAIGTSYIVCRSLGADVYGLNVQSAATTQTWSFKDVYIREAGLTQTSYMVRLQQITGAIIERVKWGGGYQQLLTQNVLSSSFIECVWFAGFRGGHFTRLSPAPVVSPANAVRFLRCQILSMRNQGFWVEGCTQFQISGGSMEGCGSDGDTTFRGIYFQGNTGDGTQGLLVEGFYVESCSGYPFYITHSGNRGWRHTFKNNNFNNNASRFPVSQIIVLGGDYAYPTNVRLILELQGNTMKGFGYTGSSTRPDVSISGYANNQCIFLDYDNEYIPSQGPVVQDTVYWKRSVDHSFDGKISSSGSLSDRRNIVSTTKSSTGTYLITSNHTLDGDNIQATLAGGVGFVQVNTAPSGLTTIIRTYDAAGTLSDRDFYVRSLATRTLFSAT